MSYVFSDEERRIYEALQIPLAIYQYEADKVITLLVSDGFCQLAGMERGRLLKSLNSGLFKTVHPDDAGKLLELSRAFGKKLCQLNVLFRFKIESGADYHILHTVGKWQIMPDGTELVIVSYSDVTQGMAEVNRLTEGYEIFKKDRFYNDSVTGLPNLNYLYEFGGEYIDKFRLNEKTPMLIYFDVMAMQSYNNQYGFSKGDELLQLIAGVLKDLFSGSVISRGYDDHFLVISDFSDAESLSDKIAQANERIKTGAYGNTTGIQAGVCLLEEDMKISSAINHAKHALREIENDLNINYCIFTNDTDEAYWEQRYIIETFENALKEERIKVHYQCIMRLATGNASALEALARWMDPDRGIIMPSEFVPVLEKYHLMHKLDLYMVEQICKEVEPRRKLGLPLIPVSINFSAQDFDYVDLVGSINAILEKYHVSRNKIIIEITEQAVAMATHRFDEQMKQLYDNGYRIWVDDFGSGYSSLNVFSRYNFDLIKFDQEFLKRLDENNGANRHIFRAMVGVANTLGIHTLAEGMESKEHMDFLKEASCEFVQGFYYYRPESLEAIAFKIHNGVPIVLCDPVEDEEP